MLEYVAMLQSNRHRAEATGRDAEQPRAAPRSGRIEIRPASRIGKDFGNDVVLEWTAQAVDPERVGASDPVLPFVRPVRGRDDGRRNFALA